MNASVRRWGNPVAASLLVNALLFAYVGDWFLRESAVPSALPSVLHVRIVDIPLSRLRVDREHRTDSPKSAPARETAHAPSSIDQSSRTMIVRRRVRTASAEHPSADPEQQSTARNPFMPEVAPSATATQPRAVPIAPVSLPPAVNAATPVQIASSTGPGYGASPEGDSGPAPATNAGSGQRLPGGDGGGGTGGGAGGRSLPFGLATSGGSGSLRIVYVLDVSPSMASRIDRARQELMDSLKSLSEDDLFDIFVFGGNVDKMEDYLEPATRDDLSEAHRFLSHGPIPSTDLDEALSEALRMDHVNEIVLITDGEPTMGETDPKILESEIRNRNLNHVRIDAIGLVGINPNGTGGRFDAAGLLRSIARDSGGDFKLVPVGLPDSD